METPPIRMHGAMVQTHKILVGLIAGTYTVTVTDQNFCVNTNSFVVTQPTIITLSATSTSVLCNGQATGSIRPHR